MTFLERVDMLIAEKGTNRNTVAKEVEGLNHSSFHAWKKRGINTLFNHTALPYH